ncbi:MAG: N-acetylmuramoyl-L-alanine amidase [Chlamydiota bacterium]
MRVLFFLLAFFISTTSSFASLKKEPGRRVASVLQSAPGAPTIVIDAGHGGTDRGAKGRLPYCEEKKICLLTARLVKKYLDQLGYHVVMTRNTDSFIPLPRRVEIASQASGAIFVSVHFNSSRNSTAHGIEVFFHDSKQERSKASSSKKLADAILGRVIRRTSAQSRGVKKGNFYVIRETHMPSVLVEGGFISNPQERSLLKSRDYQEKIARGIADGIDHYFKARWHPA